MANLGGFKIKPPGRNQAPEGRNQAAAAAAAAGRLKASDSGSKTQHRFKDSAKSFYTHERFLFLSNVALVTCSQAAFS